MNKKWLVLGLCVLFTACTQVDDYMLGKDNTPKPKALTPLVSKVHLKTDWSVPIGKGNKSRTYLKLKPVIQSNIVYTADAAGMVQAIDKRQGQIMWSQQLNEGIISGPTVKEGYVVIATDAANLFVLKQTDGHELWHAKLSSDALSKSAIAQGKVLAKTIDGNLYAFNALTGEKLWLAGHEAPNLILKASSSPVILDHLILVGFSDGRLNAIDIHSGRDVWQRSIAYASGSSDVERLVDIDADPIVRNGVAYLATYQGYVGALALDNGQFIWNKPASTYKNMAIDANTLYMTDSADVVWAFDRQTGQVKWKQVSLKARGLTEPALFNNQLVVGDKTGYLHLIATQTGELIAREQLSAPIDISPAVSGRNIYVMTSNGKLTRLSEGSFS